MIDGDVPVIFDEWKNVPWDLDEGNREAPVSGLERLFDWKVNLI